MNPGGSKQFFIHNSAFNKKDNEWPKLVLLSD